MLGNKFEIARIRAFLHRNSYRRLLFLLFCGNMISLVLLASIAYMIFFRPSPTFYATAPQGIILPMSQLLA